MRRIPNLTSDRPDNEMYLDGLTSAFYGSGFAASGTRKYFRSPAPEGIGDKLCKEFLAGNGIKIRLVKKNDLLFARYLGKNRSHNLGIRAKSR